MGWLRISGEIILNTIRQTQTTFGLFRKIEMHLYLSNTTLDFKSLPNANSAQKHIFWDQAFLEGIHLVTLDRTIFWLKLYDHWIFEHNLIVEITCHMLVFECKFLLVFLPMTQSILSISLKKLTLKFLCRMSSFSS